MLSEEGRVSIEKKFLKSKHLAGRAITLMEQQVPQTRVVVQEWPRRNKAWNFKTIQRFWASHPNYEAKVDGCAYGLTAEDGGLMTYEEALAASIHCIRSLGASEALQLLGEAQSL